MKRKSVLWLCLLCLALPLCAARVDTLQVKSASMNKEVTVVVITPDVALGHTPVSTPVVYLLHGHGNNAHAWLNIKPQLPQIADEKGMIFVCPDGKQSWYWDSPVDSTSRYETFISKELIAYIDSHYATIANRNGRAITGLSMGGHGALWNALRHKEVFGAAGSTSGGVDIRPFPQSWNMAKQLGALADYPKRWDEHTVINLVDSLVNGEQALIIDCGEADFFLNVNKNLHQQLIDRKIDHDFTTRPGGHNGTYWNNSIDYQILFFDKFFKKK